jgi:hypothetical protein
LFPAGKDEAKPTYLVRDVSLVAESVDGGLDVVVLVPAGRGRVGVAGADRVCTRAGSQVVRAEHGEDDGKEDEAVEETKDDSEEENLK